MPRYTIGQGATVNKIKYLILIILFVIPFCLADDIIELESYKQNTDIDIKAHCQHTGGSCSDSASCNITVDYPPPDTNYMVFDQSMTQNRSFYNYTLSDSSNLGWYSMTISCVDGSYEVTNNYKFQITETGDESSTLFIYIIELIMKIAFFVFLIVICIWGIRSVKKAEKTPYKLVALLRSLWAGASYGMIIISPLIALFLFHPNFDIGIVQRLTLNTYLILLVIASPIIMFNMFYFGSQMLMKLGGLYYDAEATNLVLNDLDKFTGKLSRWKNKISNKMFRRGK